MAALRLAMPLSIPLTSGVIGGVRAIAITLMRAEPSGEKNDVPDCKCCGDKDLESRGPGQGWSSEKTGRTEIWRAEIILRWVFEAEAITL